MVELELKYGLPFCKVTLAYKGQSMIFDNVILDTGSGGSVFKMDKVDQIGITIEDNDLIEAISGIGGSEFVYKKNVDAIRLGDAEVENFTIEVGVMDYGFEIDGIIGIDFLRDIGAIIDLSRMVLYSA